MSQSELRIDPITAAWAAIHQYSQWFWPRVIIFPLDNQFPGGIIKPKHNIMTILCIIISSIIMTFLYCRSQNQNDVEGTVPGQTFVGGLGAGDVHPHHHHHPDSKTCCGVSVSQTVSIRWFIVMIAFVGICCAVVGTVLGAMKASGREHLTVSLLMIGQYHSLQYHSLHQQHLLP